MKIFYQIEDRKVVGWTPGTEIFGDPSSTKGQMEKWVSENPGVREVIICDPDKDFFRPVDASLLKVENGKVVMKTEKEVGDEKTAADSAKQQRDDSRKSVAAAVKAKLVAGQPLSSQEAAWLLEGRT